MCFSFMSGMGCYIYININNINILLSSPLSQRRGHNTSPDNTIGEQFPQE